MEIFITNIKACLIDTRTQEGPGFLIDHYTVSYTAILNGNVLYGEKTWRGKLGENEISNSIVNDFFKE